MSEDGINRPTTGCGTCDDVNLKSATYGIIQAVSCVSNDIDSVDEAIELVQKDIEYQRSLHPVTDHTGGDA